MPTMIQANERRQNPVQKPTNGGKIYPRFVANARSWLEKLLIWSSGTIAIASQNETIPINAPHKTIAAITLYITRSIAPATLRHSTINSPNCLNVID